MTPAVSVIVPYRDAADTIEEALASVLAEREVALELVAIDDGSTDDGPARVERVAASDPRVRHLRTPPRGIAAALRFATECARAPFLARMDADDVTLPGRFAAQLDALERDARLGAIGGLVEAFPAEVVGEGLARYVAWQNDIVTADEHARALFVESPLCHPSVMLRASALRAVGGYRDGDVPEDYDLWLRLAEHGFSLAKVPRLVLRWRHREGRLTFADARCSKDAFRRCKARYLAARLRREARAIVVWGAGREGRRLARELGAHGVFPSRFVDIDPRKIGRVARGVAIGPAEGLDPSRDFVVAAVASRGARDEIRARLEALRFAEGRDFVCAA